MRITRWKACFFAGAVCLLALPCVSMGQFRLADANDAPDEAETVQLALGPYVQYSTPSEAVVYWWTADDCASVVEYGLAGPGAKHSPSIRLVGPHRGKLEHRLEHPELKRRHAMVLPGLEPGEVYAYRVLVPCDQGEASTHVYELDTAMNYTVRPLPAGATISEDAEHAKQVREFAAEVLKRTDLSKGYCLVWGVTDGALLYELAVRSDLTVLGIDPDADRVQAVRQRLYEAGVYGTRISVQHVPDLAALPYPSNFANLIVSERAIADGQCPGKAAEMYRVLQPRRGRAVLYCLGKHGRTVENWLKADGVEYRRNRYSEDVFLTVSKPRPEGFGSWTHQYGDTGNTADSHDELGGATGTDQLQVQWLGRPGADFGIDRNPRMPAPLAANGRLFHQGMNRMVALDAYNGTILWSLEVPDMQRVNLPRDASNWCADDETLYLAVRDRCWAINHTDGRLRRTFDLPKAFPSEDHEWGYVACHDRKLFGSTVTKGAIYTEFWGHDAWYDRTTGTGTGKVCSEGLFAYDLRTGKPLWERQGGLAINTTIGVSDRGLFFVESRNEALRTSDSRRLNDPLLWADQYLVCLNAETGELAWERPIDTADGIVVFFLACRDDAIVIASSAEGKYHLYKFDATNGDPLWHVEHKWPSDNHGGHMQHPVVLADRVFLEPCGYDLATGKLLTSAMSGREGCATYCGTRHALVHRGQSRCITMWDFRTGRTTSWANLRPSCWLSTIVGDGMVLSPEGGGGCSCGNWLETSLAFAPRAARRVSRADPKPLDTPELNGGGE